jgi:hypothetical protein
VKVGGLADQRDHGGVGAQQGFQSRVVLGFDSPAARHAERTNPRVLQIQILDTLKELSVFLVRKRITPFDEIDAQLIEPLGNQLLSRALTLLRLGVAVCDSKIAVANDNTAISKHL